MIRANSTAIIKQRQVTQSWHLAGIDAAVGDVAGAHVAAGDVVLFGRLRRRLVLLGALAVADDGQLGLAQFAVLLHRLRVPLHAPAGDERVRLVAAARVQTERRQTDRLHVTCSIVRYRSLFVFLYS